MEGVATDSCLGKSWQGICSTGVWKTEVEDLQAVIERSRCEFMANKLLQFRPNTGLAFCLLVPLICNYFKCSAYFLGNETGYIATLEKKVQQNSSTSMQAMLKKSQCSLKLWRVYHCTVVVDKIILVISRQSQPDEVNFTQNECQSWTCWSPS